MFVSVSVKQTFEYQAINISLSLSLESIEMKWLNCHSNLSHKNEIELSKKNNGSHMNQWYMIMKWRQLRGRIKRCRQFCGQMKHVCKTQCTFAALFDLGSISTKQTTFTCFKSSIYMMTIDKKPTNTRTAICILLTESHGENRILDSIQSWSWPHKQKNNKNNENSYISCLY